MSFCIEGRPVSHNTSSHVFLFRFLKERSWFYQAPSGAFEVPYVFRS